MSGHEQGGAASGPPPIPRGLCQCGCGGKTGIAKRTYSRYGIAKGQPHRFLPGHRQEFHGLELPPDPYADDPLSWTRVIFRPLANFPGYGIDTDGIPWSCCTHGRVGRWQSRWKPLATSLVDGYPMATFSVRGRRKTVRVSRLVLATFVGDVPVGIEACHCNGRRRDNRLCNLRWDTKAGNQADRVRHGTHSRGTRNGRARLNEELLAELSALRAGGASYRELARRTGLHHSTIRNALSGKTWSDALSLPLTG